ncbi:transcriptional regulator [Streptomyces sp. NPDC090306]|uniref:transcriptional regulator n=1 Tax=Streptomyces sp. NPDC090306 TaxID=3365961 RepID=UPI0038017898
MKRRTMFAAVSGAALTQYFLQSALAPSEAVAARFGAASASDGLVASLQSTTDELRRLDAAGGSGSLAETGRTHLRTLLHLLKHGSYSEQLGQRLAAVAADTAAQTGWYTFDGGAPDRAQHLFLGALRAAHSSGDSRLKAAALGFLAIHAYSVGDPRDAVTAARAARQTIAGQDAPALNAMLLTRQARGHAKLREEKQVLVALEEATELCARPRGEDDPHWLYWINQGEILGQTGSCYLELGHPARAAAAFASAHDVLHRAETRTTAQFLSRAATAQMRDGNVDSGCATAHEVLSLTAEIRSARLDDHVQTMLREAQAHANSPAARDLLDRGRDLTTQQRSKT